jgi:hypothetical protein
MMTILAVLMSLVLGSGVGVTGGPVRTNSDLVHVMADALSAGATLWQTATNDEGRCVSLPTADRSNCIAQYDAVRKQMIGDQHAALHVLDELNNNPPEEAISAQHMKDAVDYNRGADATYAAYQAVGRKFFPLPTKSAPHSEND